MNRTHYVHPSGRFTVFGEIPGAVFVLVGAWLNDITDEAHHVEEDSTKQGPAHKESPLASDLVPRGYNLRIWTRGADKYLENARRAR